MTTAGKPQPGQLTTATALIALALFIAVTVAYGCAALLVGETVYAGDAGTYITTARTLAEDGEFRQDYLWHYNYPFSSVSHPMLDRRPLTIVLMAAVFRLLPEQPLAVKLLHVSISALTVSLTFIGGVFLTGRRRDGLLAALLLATNRTEISYAIVPLAEPFLQLFMCLCCWFLYRAVTANRPAWLLAAGTAAGCAWLARNQGLTIIVPLLLTGLWLAWQRRSLRHAAFAAAAVLLFFAINLPWQLWVGQYSIDSDNYKNNLRYSRSVSEFYSYGHAPSLENYLRQPAAQLARAFVASYYRNLDNFSVHYAWPLMVLAAVGALHQLRHPLLLIALGQFLLVFLLLPLALPATAVGCIGENYYFAPVVAFCAACGWGVIAQQLTAVWPRLRYCLPLLLAALLLFQAIDATHKTYATFTIEQQVDRKYRRLAAWLQQHDPQATVMVTDPSRYNWLTRQRAIMLPALVTPDTVVVVARRYGATYMADVGDRDSTVGLYRGTRPDPRFQVMRDFAAPEGEPGAMLLFRLAGDTPAPRP